MLHLLIPELYLDFWKPAVETWRGGPVSMKWKNKFHERPVELVLPGAQVHFEKAFFFVRKILHLFVFNIFYVINKTVWQWEFSGVE